MRVDEIRKRNPVTGPTAQTLKERIHLRAVNENAGCRRELDLRAFEVVLPNAAQLDRKGLADLSFASGSLDRLKEHRAGSASAWGVQR